MAQARQYNRNLSTSASVDISFLIPFKKSVQLVEETLKNVVHYLNSQTKYTYEIILIPNASSTAEDLQAHAVCDELTIKYPHTRVFNLPYSGKGAAVQAGFLMATGRWIFFSDVDLPYGTEFFDRAIEKLNEGCDFVTGNRRAHSTYHKPSVDVRSWKRQDLREFLSFYFFNAFVRILFGLKTNDTQAGIKAYSAEFAKRAFSLQMEDGFLFDVEHFIVCNEGKYTSCEIPVAMIRETTHSTVRLRLDIFKSLARMFVIFGRRIKGYYRTSLPLVPNELNQVKYATADDWGMSASVNEGILKLAEQGLIRRVSVLVDGPAAGVKLKELLAIEGVQVGLHFQLTHSQPNSFLKNYVMAMLIPARAKNYFNQIALEIERQWNALHTLAGRADYVDGHHHVHVFPKIIDQVIHVMQAKKCTTIRLPYDRTCWLSPFGLVNFFSKLAQKKIERNGFHYLPFRYPTLDQMLKPTELKKILLKNPNHEILFHPGFFDYKSNSTDDSFRNRRMREYISLSKIL